jgi:hypothetical protein
MNPAAQWREEFGLPEPGGDVFFASYADLRRGTDSASHTHVLRRAFDLLHLDGVVCTDSTPLTPLVYFKRVPEIDPSAIVRLHRTFWNHGGAPILVLIAPNEVHVYSGLVRPVAEADAEGHIPGLVQRLDRASAALREFLPAVESGEFFRRHQPAFNPAHRVDRHLLDNLQATRQQLLATAAENVDSNVVDALLCRLVFVCYLFDREVVGESYLEDLGLRGTRHLRDLLSLPPADAIRYLYDLFRKLGADFNGDLFSDDLDSEARLVPPSYIPTLDDFFRATDVETGQGSFWPYDFAAIPVEVISSIYERFLKGSDREQLGAVYTPRVLAELVLDIALADGRSLLGRRYLDPAAGSGIFLVGLFNRMAEEWRHANPDANNDRRARDLRTLLCTNLCGVDINPTACRITAFSLYLAYLDQLSPRDIQELQRKGHALPRLVHYADPRAGDVEGNLWCGDFFAEPAAYPTNADLVIGNPPWGSSATDDTPAAQWCARHDRPYFIPDKQIASAFVWKAVHHVVDDAASICLVLPHGTIFHHSDKAIEFQRALFTHHAADYVLNLADYQRFLFEEAGNPAIVLRYRRPPPESRRHALQYWAPKTDWLVTRADVISILPEDRSTLTVGAILDDLLEKDAPQIWKQHYWATPRDRRLVDRLSLYPRLRDLVRHNTERAPDKRWLIAEGFQPAGLHDDQTKVRTLRLPSDLFVEATSPGLNLLLLPEDCETLSSMDVRVRGRSNRTTEVFRAPHVLVAQGFTSIAFADFDVSFQHALRGISGPKEDRDLLIFLAAYLRSPLARFFLFHTSSNWGVSRQKVHVKELLRLPFPLPETLPDADRARKIIGEVGRLVVASIAHDTNGQFDVTGRRQLVPDAEHAIERLINEYFDVLEVEKTLIDDTVRVIIPSVRPTRRRASVPTIDPSTETQRQEYVQRLCHTLNSWATTSPHVVHGRSVASATRQLGIGLAILQKTQRGATDGPLLAFDEDESRLLLAATARLQQATSRRLSVVDLPRDAKVFDGDRLYVLKPIGQRFWTQTAALNDADEIVGSILLLASQDAV